MKRYLISFQLPNFVYQALTIQVSAMYKGVDYLMATNIQAIIYQIKAQ